MKKDKYFEMYTAAHKNACDLLAEAHLLFEHEHFARTYALAFTALEEISKSQFAADVVTGLRKQEDFEKFYKDHSKKIGGMRWAHLDASSFPNNLKWVGPDRDDMETMDPQKPTFQKRQEALFVGIDFQNSRITTPKEKITEQDAKEIIHIVDTALWSIWENTEYWGHQIGTKGFMK
jgi:AbiV family abortive infection protein